MSVLRKVILQENVGYFAKSGDNALRSITTKAAKKGTSIPIGRPETFLIEGARETVVPFKIGVQTRYFRAKDIGLSPCAELELWAL